MHTTTTTAPADPDPVNHPSHYTYGPIEAIAVIEAAVRQCDDPVSAYLHATTLKYLLRLWHKDNPVQDASKAEWYLRRLIEHRLDLSLSCPTRGKEVQDD